MSSSGVQYRYGERYDESHARAAKARELRKNQTPPEGILWSRLRNRQVDGLKFRRQYPVGRVVLDFFCEEIKLAVEVDGDVHGSQREYDARCDHWLREQGIGVMRVTASEVSVDLDDVVERIWKEGRRMREEKS